MLIYKNLEKWVLVVFTLTAVSTVQAGVDSSGGADNLQWNQSAAWFIGKSRTIQTCVKVDEKKFGVSQSELIEHVRSTFGHWIKYLDMKKIEFRYGNTGYARTLIVSENCKGNEDLTFYFAVENEMVKKGKAEYRNPTSFSYKTDYDPTTQWSKGFIWVTEPGKIEKNYPDWNKREDLDAILLHEIGHLLGNSHVSGTIMSANINHELMTNDIDPANKYRIDHTRELAHCIDSKCGQREFRAAVDPKFFEKMMGRKPKFPTISLISNGYFGWDAIILRDDEGSRVFSIDDAESQYVGFGNGTIFRLPGPGGFNPGMTPYHDFGTVTNAYLKGVNGSVLLRINYNQVTNMGGSCSGCTPIEVDELVLDGKNGKVNDYTVVRFDTE